MGYGVFAGLRDLGDGGFFPSFGFFFFSFLRESYY